MELSMSIMERLATLWHARANRALDAVESKDLSSILEANLETEKHNLQQAEIALNEVGGQVKTMEQDVASLERSVADWAHNAETALGKGNEVLAKQALVRQTAVEQELSVKKQALEAVKASHAKLTNDILAREESVRDVTSKLGTLRAEEKAANVTLEARKTVGAFAGDGNAAN